MKLRRIKINRLPGIEEPFSLDDIDDRIQIVIGPNGIGKSSLCRASRALLWNDEPTGGAIDVQAVLEYAGKSLTVERNASLHRWQRNGIDCPAPPLPPAHERHCFFLGLRDLLDPESAAGQDLAKQLRREMSGGFDLDEVRAERFGSAGKVPRGRSASFEQASRAVREARRLQNELAREEDSLAEREEERSQAQVAQRRLAAFECAVEVRNLRSALDDVRGLLDELPAVLGQLHGDELGRADKLDESLRRRRGQLRKCQEQLDAARSSAQASRLSDPIDEATLQSWRARADTLADREKQLDDARCDRARADTGLEQASRGLGAIDAAGDLEIGLPDAAELFRLLRDTQRFAREMGNLDNRIQLLGRHSFEDQERERIERLRRGREVLRAWLRAPDPDAIAENRRREARRRRPAGAASIVLILTAAGGGLGWWLRPELPLFAERGLELALGLAAAGAAGIGLGLGLAIAARLRTPIGPEAYAREAATRDYPSTLEQPSTWQANVVSEQLGKLDEETADLEAKKTRARDRAIEREALEDERSHLEETAPGLESRRSELARQLGLAEIPADAELVDMALALDQLRKAGAKAAEAEAYEQELQRLQNESMERLADGLRPFGDFTLRDATSARAAVEHVSARSRSLEKATEQTSARSGEIRRIEEDIQEDERSRAEIDLAAGCPGGDRFALARLLEDFDRHRDLVRRRDGHARDLAKAERMLEESGESQLSERSREDLEDEMRTLSARASKLEELREQISGIREAVKLARRGHHLEDALAKQSDALDELLEQRDGILNETAGSFLLDQVQREHETSHMPRVLGRARELFAAFTHHAYELRLASGEEASFVAIEAKSGLGRCPGELSDGTRAQLGLAARLAFVKEAEGDEPLPLFLDEALDHSDPARFDVIARSLGRMAEDEGRQIFYFTNDPGDVLRFERALAEEGCTPARVIDLAEVRKRRSSISGPGDLEIEPLPVVPGPRSGESAESYGARLGVRTLDPRREPADQHLIHLLWDDLPLLQRLLQLGIETVGQWHQLSRSGEGLAREIQEMPQERGRGAELDDRQDLLQAFIQLWREGRGRPVDREVIERSDAVSDRYRDPVCEIARELAGDAEGLIDALGTRSDRRPQGFRSAAAKKLEAFLLDEGYIDPNPILDHADVIARALGMPAAGRLPDDVRSEFLHRWWALSANERAGERFALSRESGVES